MRAVVYDRPREFEIREIPTPEAGPGEVRVRVTQAGLCGTDLHLHEGQFMAAYPMTPGHETIGIVDQLGEGVESLTVGEQVAVNPNMSCRQCAYCREGRPLLCEHMTGFGTTLPGGFAEYVVVPERQVFSTEDLEPDVAVFTEPTSCVMHGLDVIRPRAGSSALVFGAGPTGLLLAQMIGAAGATQVTVAAPTEFKLETARSLGVDRTFQMDRARLAADVDELRRLSGGDGYDLVVDATGNAKVSESCVSLTRNGGTIVFYGVNDESSRIEISPYEIFRRELTVKGSFASLDSFPEALAALRAGRVRTTGVITHRFPLEEYGAALEALRSDPAAHKIVITL